MLDFINDSWLQWHYELQKASKCVAGEAYGYSSQYMYGCGDRDRNRLQISVLFYVKLATKVGIE
jgi:hypothetical protein